MKQVKQLTERKYTTLFLIQRKNLQNLHRNMVNLFGNKILLEED